MGGTNRYLWLPFLACMLPVVACGVPIPPDAITATAVAEEQARINQQTSQPVSGTESASNTAAINQRTASLDLITAGTNSAAPIATREAAAGVAEDEDVEVSGEGSTESGTQTDGEATPTATPSTAGAPAVARGGPAPDINFVTEFVTLLNQMRTARGIAPLNFNASISAGASSFAAYMATAQFFGHYGPDGSSPSSRLIASGYFGLFKGEALTAGQASPQSALNALLASGPHASILLDASAVEVGIGHAAMPGSAYGNYWVVVTAVP